MPNPRVPPVLRDQVIERYGMICHLCSGPIELADLSMDHIIPRSRGGKTDIDNLKPAHRECNRLKDNLTPTTDRNVIRHIERWAGRKGRRRRR